MTNDDTRRVDSIEAIRTANNRLWMQILRIALEHSPEETKAVLAAINGNDRQIGAILAQIAEGEGNADAQTGSK